MKSALAGDGETWMREKFREFSRANAVFDADETLARRERLHRCAVLREEPAPSRDNPH